MHKNGKRNIAEGGNTAMFAFQAGNRTKRGSLRQCAMREFERNIYLRKSRAEGILTARNTKAAAQASPRGHALCAVHRQARQKLSGDN